MGHLGHLSRPGQYFFTHKSTFRVHYSTGSLGQLDLRVAGFPGHWVAGSGTANLASVLLQMTQQDRYTRGQQPGVCRNVQFYVTKCAVICIVLFCAVLTAHLSVGSNRPPGWILGREKEGEKEGSRRGKGRKRDGRKGGREQRKKEGKGKEKKLEEETGKNFVQL